MPTFAVPESSMGIEKRIAFFGLPTDRTLKENRLALALLDAFPVTEGDALIIPKHYVSDYFEISQPELNTIQSFVYKMRAEPLQEDSGFLGFNSHPRPDPRTIAGRSVVEEDLLAEQSRLPGARPPTGWGAPQGRRRPRRVWNGCASYLRLTIL